MKTFCIAGPANPSLHYFVDRRLEWDRVNQLITGMNYFHLKAPRASGKSTAILEFVSHLQKEGTAALYITVEQAHAVPANKALYQLLRQLHLAQKRVRSIF